MAVDPVHTHHATTGSDRKSIVFVGDLNYFPNVLAVTWLVESVMPLLRRWGIILRIVGAANTAVKAKLSTSDVLFLGYVPDLATEMRRAAVGVAPQTLAGGLNTKILSYASFGLPIVATEQARAGLISTPPISAFVSDAEAFAVAVLEVRDKMAGANQDWLLNTYGTTVTISRWHDAFAFALGIS